MSYHTDEQMKLKVWAKGVIILDYEPSKWRRDIYGFVMKYSDYEISDSEYSWQIDHILPVARGGGDEYQNLQPLHRKNNLAKGDTYPWQPGQ
jgi:hypothetical protein